MDLLHGSLSWISGLSILLGSWVWAPCTGTLQGSLVNLFCRASLCSPPMDTGLLSASGAVICPFLYYSSAMLEPKQKAAEWGVEGAEGEHTYL